MHPSLRKYFWIFGGLFLLPILLFMGYQYFSYQENEKLAITSFEKQLEVIIFSINQYGLDFHLGLINKLEKSNENSIDLSENLDLLKTGGISHIFILRREKPLAVFGDSLLLADLTKFIKREERRIKKLSLYFSQGYRKIEPAGIWEAHAYEYQILLAPMIWQGDTVTYVGLLDPKNFASEILSPKLQEISGQSLYVAVTKADNRSQILYSSDSVSQPDLLARTMWLMPDYSLLVGLRDSSYISIILRKQRIGYVAMAFLLAVVSLGIYLIVKTIWVEQELSQQKADFVSNVSHELRTPLAMISMFSETILLGRVISEEKKREYVEIIFRESQRLGIIVNRILNFGKMEAGVRTFVLQKLEINQLIQDFLLDYSFHLNQKQCLVIKQLHVDPIYIHADRDALYEALVILTDNALKYSINQKEITFISGVQDQLAFISVKDKGQGIATQYHHAIFEKFYRIERAETQTTQGAGLGLSILKHIMDKQAATISLESTPGIGSTFTLFFKKSNT